MNRQEDNQNLCMETKESKEKKTMEEAELKVVLLGEDVVVGGSTTTTTTTTTCLAAGTEITMADGTIRNIEDIAEGDFVLSFDHKTGNCIGSEVMYVYRGDALKRAFTLCFSDGKELSVVGEHDLFEQENRKYVYISEENAEQYIGKHFHSVAKSTYVELTGVIYETEETNYYEIYTKNTLNTVANGMLNVADDVDHILNIYEFNEDLKADQKALEEDIQAYGLFEFSRKYGISEQEYIDWNMCYLNIAVGKGLVSWEVLWNQHGEYMNQRESAHVSKCA